MGFREGTKISLDMRKNIRHTIPVSPSLKKILFTVVVCAVLFIPGGIYVGKTKNNSLATVVQRNEGDFSADIFYITNPVTSLSGVIDKKEGDTLWFTHSALLIQDSSQKAAPTSAVKTVSYKVKVTDGTRVQKSVLFIPYLAKQVSPPTQATGSVSDLQAGQSVIVTTGSDLRLNKTYEFDATSIQLTPPINTVQGMITSVTASGLTVKGVVRKQIFELSQGDGNAQQEKVFTFSVSSDTEISRFSAPAITKPGETANLGAPKVEILSLKDLVVGNQVVVYAGQDVTKSQSLTALRVEPIGTIPDNTRLPSPPPQLSPTASGAAETKKLE